MRYTPGDISVAPLGGPVSVCAIAPRASAHRRVQIVFGMRLVDCLPTAGLTKWSLVDYLSKSVLHSTRGRSITGNTGTRSLAQFDTRTCLHRFDCGNLLLRGWGRTLLA